MGSSKKQTVGHRYYMGLHLVLCRQADALMQINMASKEAWRGSLASGRGSINKPGLFGGDTREGGFSGFFDFLRGQATQPINDYLSGVLGDLVPAYRGVVSTVMRRPYVGANTARLPNMKFKLMNTVGVHRGWYPEKAVFTDLSVTGSSSVYIAWNVPGSITTTQLDAMKEWLTAVVQSFVGSGAPLYIQQFGVETSSSIEDTTTDYSDALAWINDMAIPTDSGGQSNWNTAFAPAPAFFSQYYDNGSNFPTGALATGFLRPSIDSESQLDGRRNIVILLGLHPAIPGTPADAAGHLAQVLEAEVFAFRMDAAGTADYDAIDNTEIDGVPVIDSADPQPSTFLNSGLLVGWADMNPAHIIRCLWSDPLRGGVVDDSEFGTSFTTEADRFYAERFGLSPRFDQFETVEQARLDVERHVDCISFRSRVTGLIEIKAIRNDYDPVDLQVLDSSIVMDWSGLEKSTPSETPNQLTVVYTKRENGETASVTRTNTAGVRRAGRVIPGDPIEYLSCNREDLAIQLCLRDLSVQNRPLLTGPLVLAYFPPDLDIGDPFIINEPKLKISNAIVRILEVQEGDGTDNRVTVTIAEDEFAMPAAAAIGPVQPPPVVDGNVALPCLFEYPVEAPYYLLVLSQDQATVDEALVDEPDLGFLLPIGTKPTASHRSITLGIDTGAGYEDRGEIEFAPMTTTLNYLSADADDLLITVPATTALRTITANSLALIGNEIVRIDAMAENGADIDITIGRGCLDTVPVEQPIGSGVVFLQQADVLSAPSFVAPDAVNVKLLTNLSSKRLSLFAAPEYTVSFDSRAIRPYRPAALQLNGSYSNSQNIVDVTDVVLAWNHQDRTLQTTLVPEDFTSSDIGPETGVTYRVVVTAVDELYNSLGELDNVNVGTATTYDWDDATVLPIGTNRLMFAVASEKGAYVSWQSATIYFSVLFTPANISFDLAAGTVTLNWEDTNSGTMQEDDFAIYRSTTAFDYTTLPAVFDTVAADSTSYVDNTVVLGTDYYYAVAARRDGFVSAAFFGPITAI